MTERTKEATEKQSETDDPRVLVVDDEDSLCELLELILEEEGFEVETAQNRDDALEAFRNGSFDVVLQDIKLEDTSGINLLDAYQDIDPSCRVIMITAHSTWESAVEAMRQGAFDYFKKPFDNEAIRSGVRNAVESECVEPPGDETDEHPIYSNIIGDSDAIKEVRQTIHKVAPSNVTVLICGESGTGKELVARSLHFMSRRRDQPFMSINCGAFPEKLLESELFGHKKGAFTGAHEDKQGILEVADGGTLFLDEIAEMPPEMQVKLLRVLENQSFKPVGGVEKRSVDLRFIAATNKNIEERVSNNQFREDLYYRLNVIHMNIPPLRKRGDDILLLAGYFLNDYADAAPHDISGFTDRARKRLMNYDWPGNVRELKNAVRRAVALAEEETIPSDVLFQEQESAGQRAISVPDSGINLEEHLENLEKRYIRTALQKTDQNITEAAELLETSFRSLRYKLDKYDMKPGDSS